MSDEKNEQQARLAEIEQDARAYLIDIADAVPLATVDAWLKEIGFGSFTQTRNGQTLVREIMRRAMHQVAPFFADVRMKRETAEKERDELRGRMDKLPDTVRFFDEQLDVQALLAEVEKAQEQDRPCVGGEPQMIQRLAYVIRTYRGMETNDKAVPIGVGLIGQPVAQTARTSVQSTQMNATARIQLDLGAEADRRISAMAVDQWLHEHGATDVVPEWLRALLPGLCRWATQTAAADYVGGIREEERKQREEYERQIREFAKNARAINQLLDDAGISMKLSITERVVVVTALLSGVKNALREGGWDTDKPGNLDRLVNTVELLTAAHTDRDKLRAAHDALWQDIRSIVGPIIVDETTKNRGPDAINKAYLSALRSEVQQGRDLVRSLDAAFTPEEKKAKEHLTPTHRAARLISEHATMKREIRDAHNVLTDAGAGFTDGVQDRDTQSKQPLASRVARVVRQWNEMADERGRIHLMLTKRGAPPKSDNMAEAVNEFLEAIESALDKLDWPSFDSPIERIQSLMRLIESKSTESTDISTIYHNIRSIVGPVDVTDVDREAVTEEDAANGPDAREYYAERWALLRTMRERDGKYHNLRILLERHHIDIVSDFANSMRILETILQELKDVRAILREGGQGLDKNGIVATVERIMHENLFDSDEPSNELHPTQQEAVPLNLCWMGGRSTDIHISLPLLRGLTAIIAEPMRGGSPSILTRRQRIIRMYHALLALAATHGVLLDEHANDDLSEDGPVFDG
jgi:hypothetical protein